MLSFLVLGIYLLLSPAMVRGQGEIIFSMAALLKMRAATWRQHPHRYDDMETFIFRMATSRVQGRDGVTAVE
jgi:hypothetical protein